MPQPNTISISIDKGDGNPPEAGNEYPLVSRNHGASSHGNWLRCVRQQMPSVLVFLPFHSTGFAVRELKKGNIDSFARMLEEFEAWHDEHPSRMGRDLLYDHDEITLASSPYVMIRVCGATLGIGRDLPG